MASSRKTAGNLDAAVWLRLKPQDQITTKAAKRPICTHLSNQILSSQSSSGKAEPGRVSNTATSRVQKIPGRNEVHSFFTYLIAVIVG